MKLWIKVILAASVVWAIAMTVYAQIQVKEASKLGFELGVLDERLKVANEKAMMQADIAAKAQAQADVARAEADNQFQRAEEALAACERKKK